jgi:zinc carboxypeptidase
MTRATRVLLLALLPVVFGAVFPAAEPTLPTPASVIGWEPCADYKLATYEQIADYFRRLAAAAPARMKLVDMGKTVEGRTEVMAVISSEDNIRQLDKYRRISQQLARTRDGDRPLTDADAYALARDGKAVVWIDFGLHSTEVAHGQTAPLVAFKAVAEESDEMRAIRDNVILLLVPNMNPDGTTLVASWYRENLGKPWESRPPELWHRYVGHDDNRDWFMMTQPETRNAAKQLYGEWFPQIVYNQHQSGPFPSRIFVPPFDDPMNPNIPPLVIRGVNLIGDAMTRRLDREGKRGAVSRIGFDTWWNGGMRTAPYFHNMIGILTETSHASATPATYDAKNFPKFFPNTTVPTLEPTTYYPSPYRGGLWHLRDSCEYMVTTSTAVLDVAAKRRQEWLYDIYRMGRDAVRANADESFVVPADQWDPTTAVKLVNVLRLGGVDVERATTAFAAGGRQYAAGSFVIRGAQPFEPYVRDLMTAQVYPDMRLYPGGPPKRPYDITGWTLPYQMGVDVDRTSEPLAARTERVDVAPVPAVEPPRDAQTAIAVDPRENDAFVLVNRLLAAGDDVYRTTAPVAVAAAEWPAGTFLVPPHGGAAARLAQAARALGVRVGLPDPTTRASESASVWHVHAPRVGLYHGWGGNMDEGWTRWLLEQFEFPYTSLYDRDVRDGGLRSKFDVIVLPDATYGRMLNGEPPSALPDAYTGGMTARGVSNLTEFVVGGGTLVALDRAAELPLAAMGLPIRNVTAGARDSDFYAPGSILRIAVDPSEPVAYGMPPESAAAFVNSAAFAIGPQPGRAQEAAPPAPIRAGDIRIVARYPDRNLLLSGWLLGERILAGQAAVVDVPVGRGRVVLLGFRTQHRGQSHGTFKLLFNSLLLGRAEISAGKTLSSEKYN